MKIILEIIWRLILAMVTCCIVVPACVVGVAFVIAMIPVGILLLPFVFLGAEIVKHINFKNEEEE